MMKETTTGATTLACCVSAVWLARLVETRLCMVGKAAWLRCIIGIVVSLLLSLWQEASSHTCIRRHGTSSVLYFSYWPSPQWNVAIVVVIQTKMINSRHQEGNTLLNSRVVCVVVSYYRANPFANCVIYQVWWGQPDAHAYMLQQ